MKKTLFVTMVLISLLVMTTSVAFAGNSFKNESSTVSGYPTWDSDLINVEAVTQTGAGVYVAVLDTGLVPNWRDYFPEERIATELGTGFDQPLTFKTGKNPCAVDVWSNGKVAQSTWVGSNGSTHGTHVVSTILGYFYRSNTDLAQGYALPPIMVRGLAPDVTIIPVRVLADYRIPALPKCTNPGPSGPQTVVFGTDEMVAAGINYATDLAIAGYKPMVISMSLGGSELAQVEKDAIDRAVANGVVVVAAAGNAGEAGMDYPGAYAPVISAGSVGWTGEWLYPSGPNEGTARYRMWWLQYPSLPILPDSALVGAPNAANVYVNDFSSRALPGQQLDVLAPGSWVRGPFPDDNGYSHLPWWSKSLHDLINGHGVNFYWLGGTSMATPHVSSAAALMLQKNPTLTPAKVESILKSTTLVIPSTGSQGIWNNTVAATITWDTDCAGVACDPVGAGLIQVDKAIAVVP